MQVDSDDDFQPPKADKKRKYSVNLLLLLITKQLGKREPDSPEVKAKKAKVDLSNLEKRLKLNQELYQQAIQGKHF